MARVAYQWLRARFDTRGGLGSPLRPLHPHELSFLLRWWHRTGDADAIAMVETALRAMRRGPIFDQIGFGFHHRYLDAGWRTPEFRKTLIDQAAMAMVYLEAFQATGHEEYAQTATELFTYMVGDLGAPEGAFFTGEQALHNGTPARYYLWTPDEINTTLGQHRGELVCRVFGIDSVGADGLGVVPRLIACVEDLARLEGLREGELRRELHGACAELFLARERRRTPQRDERIVAADNGLAIAALARGAQLLGEPAHARAAVRAADFVLERMQDEHGTLLHRFVDGSADQPASVADHACLTMGLIDLYEATFDISYLQAALSLSNTTLERYWDADLGVLHHGPADRWRMVSGDATALSGALGQANAIAATNLMRLSLFTTDAGHEDRAREILVAFDALMSSHPHQAVPLFIARDMLDGPGVEVVIASSKDDHDAADLLQALHRTYLPHKVVLFRPDEPHDHPITLIAPYTEYQLSLHGHSAAYVCRDFISENPATDAEGLLTQLGAARA